MRTVLAASLVPCVLLLFHDAARSDAPARLATLTTEQVVATRGVGDVAIAPDGAQVAYVVSVPRSPGDAAGVPYQEIWVADTRSGTPRAFTPAEQRAWAPAFSPDGRSIAFLSTRQAPGGDDKETTGLYLLPLAGGEARRVGDEKLSVDSFLWSPRGDRLAFTARDLETEQEKQDKKEGRDHVVVDATPKPLRLWAADVAGGAPVRLSTGDEHVLGFDWAPDAGGLVLRVADRPGADPDYLYSRLVMLAATGGAPTPFVRTEGKLGEPVFSPSGRFVAWLGATDFVDPFAGSVFVAPAAGGVPRSVRNGRPGCATDVAWADDATLLVAATVGTQTVLERVARDGSSVRVVAEGEPVFTEFAVSQDGARVALAASTPRQPNEVYAGELGRSKLRLRRLSDTNPELAAVRLGSQSVFRWRAADGLDLEGVLVRPVGIPEDARSPLVVVVHGGPESCYRNGWNTSPSTWTQLLARDGYVVFLPNYRGSIGRDEAFERGDHGDLMGKEFEDILGGIDALVERGLVDPARVGICGGSYGGYASAWAATKHSRRFAAAVEMFGITNWLSMQGTSDIPEENAFVHWNRPFHSHMDLYWDRSPLAHVNECRTPVLILHGDEDARVPVTQGTELYTSLRLLGREVEFVRYPREKHGLREAEHQRDAVARALGWFERHLKPAPGGVSARR